VCVCVCVCVCVSMVIQEKRSIFLEMTVMITVRKEIHMNICLILNGYLQTELFESTYTKTL